MKKLFILFAALALLSAACAKSSTTLSPYDTVLKIGDNNLQIQIVSTPKDMEAGLSGREKLQDNQGMLFDFGNNVDVMPNFWMKNMSFSLDLIWIDDGKIVGITKNVLPSLPEAIESQLPTYSPPSPVDRVLEVNAGWTERNKIQIGDKIYLIN